MDLASTFDQVVRIANHAEAPNAGWAALVTCLEAEAGQPFPELVEVDVAADVARLRAQLDRLCRRAPPPSGLDAVDFGLFGSVDDTGAERIGFYVAGIAGFDAEDGDSLCDPVWWPEGRDLTSTALDRIKTAERDAAQRSQSERSALLAYAGQLGAGLILARFATEGLFVGLRRVVGFDSGDFAVCA